MNLFFRFLHAFGWPYRKLKKAAVLSQFGSVGRNLIFFPESSVFYEAGKMSFGRDVFIGEGAHFSGALTVGDRVMFGPFAAVFAGDHYFAVRGKSVRSLRPRNGENSRPVKVEDEVWCGARIVVLGGVTLGMGCVVGAGSVLPKSLPPYVVAVGNPCRPVKRLFEDGALLAHLAGLGMDKKAASKVVARRRSELKKWGLTRLKAVERTGDYWEGGAGHRPRAMEQSKMENR